MTYSKLNVFIQTNGLPL